jgi:predicted nucleic acid-binding protein
MYWRAQRRHPLHSKAVDATDELRLHGERVCIVPQVVYEFWAVATRPPGENGLGMSIADAQLEIAQIKRLFELLPESPRVLDAWEALVIEHQVKGKNTHDARLVAAMKVHDIPAILTFNLNDFLRYPDIKVLTPDDAISGGSR